MKKLTALLASACVCLSLVAGCAQDSKAPAETTTTEAPAEEATEETQPPEETEAVEEAEAPEENAADRVVTVTDMSGDEVTIEGEVKNIVNLWPAGTSSFIAMGAGDLLSGLAVNSPTTMSAWAQHFYPDCVNIPELGGTSPSVEELINLDPDLVIIHPSTAKEGFAQQIRDVGIPAININFDNYETMIEAYTILGEVLGGEYQEKLTTWCSEVEEKLAKSREITADIPEEEKPVVYYIAGQDEELLTTMGQNTIMQDWVESNGGIYASKVLNLDGQEVTAEEIFNLNPDVIIVGGSYQHRLMKQIQETEGWKDLNAVKNGRVYNNPYACFNWDRFGLESRLQIEYALMCIQPELAAENGIDRDYMVNNIIEYYKYYNGTELSAQEAEYMLDGLSPNGTAEFPAES